MKKKEGVTILMNPTAGKGRSLRLRQRMERELRLAGVDYDLHISDSEAHLRELARDLGAHGGILAVAGGDSSLTLVASEILANELSVKLAFIGLGSCNDIARELETNTLRLASQALRCGHSRRMDVGVVSAADGKRLGLFLGQASMGLGVLVNREMVGVKPWRITLAAPPAVHRAFKSDRLPQHLVIDIDGETIEDDFLLLAASNLRFFARGRRVLPMARIDDGRLDLFLVRDCSFARLAMIAGKSSWSRTMDDSSVICRQGATIRVRSDEPFHMQLDGELVGGNETPAPLNDITLTMLPKALRVIS
jgi:diacylglycerol kinase (ATP)